MRLSALPLPNVLLATFLALGLTLTAVTGQEPDYTLDLQDTSASGSRPSLAELLLLTEQPPPREQLRLRLQLPAGIGQPGAPFVFELMIDNVGTVPVTLPWSGDGGVSVDVEPRPLTRYRLARIAFELMDRDRPLGRVLGPTLIGSPDITESMLQLPPGKTARIRAAGHWAPLYLADPRSGPDGTSVDQVQVTAVVSLPEYRLNLRSDPVVARRRP